VCIPWVPSIRIFSWVPGNIPSATWHLNINCSVQKVRTFLIEIVGQLVCKSWKTNGRYLRSVVIRSNWVGTILVEVFFVLNICPVTEDALGLSTVQDLNREPVIDHYVWISSGPSDESIADPFTCCHIENIFIIDESGRWAFAIVPSSWPDINIVLLCGCEGEAWLISFKIKDVVFVVPNLLIFTCHISCSFIENWNWHF
jgi:hypothetical protein